MLCLDSVKKSHGRIFCKVNNTFMGDGGFTLYEGPIEVALGNIISGIFRITQESIDAAKEAFRAIDEIDLSIDDIREDIKQSFDFLSGPNKAKRIMAGEVINMKTLPCDMKKLYLPQHQHGTHLSKFAEVQSKPIIKANSLILPLKDSNVEVGPHTILYYL